MENLVIEQRSRRKDLATGAFQEIHQTVHWNPQQTAIIICDMWDDHTCKAAAQRVAEMVPTMNRMTSVARGTGVFIIHAPSGTMSFYDGNAATSTSHRGTAYRSTGRNQVELLGS